MIGKASGTKTLKGKRAKCCCCDYKNTCAEIFLWILTFGIWASLVVAFVVDFAFLSVFFVGYTVYLLLELCSNFKDIYSSKKSPHEINELVGDLFKSTPSIEFICEIYDTESGEQHDVLK